MISFALKKISYETFKIKLNMLVFTFMFFSPQEYREIACINLHLNSNES